MVLTFLKWFCEAKQNPAVWKQQKQIPRQKLKFLEEVKDKLWSVVVKSWRTLVAGSKIRKLKDSNFLLPWNAHAWRLLLMGNLTQQKKIICFSLIFVLWKWRRVYCVWILNLKKIIMNYLREFLYRPKRNDRSLMARFFFADEALTAVASGSYWIFIAFFIAIIVFLLQLLLQLLHFQNWIRLMDEKILKDVPV